MILQKARRCSSYRMIISRDGRKVASASRCRIHGWGH